MTVMQSPPGAHTVIDGRQYVYFVGTGYLALQGHPEVIGAACDATRKYGIASATSRSGFGDTPPVLDVERHAAELFGSDEAFYFMSGYVGNSILALTLDDSFDAVFVDELSHYCVFEAARLSNRPVFSFGHCDAERLRSSLAKRLKPKQRPLVASDGVFAARGAIAPVADYLKVLGDYPGAILSVDDAHALGVLGEHGRGTYEHAGLFGHGVNDMAKRGEGDDATRLCLCGTLSKAIGGYGGIIPGSSHFMRRLKAATHYYNGASAPPVPAAAATARALELIAADPGMGTRLWTNVRALKSGLRDLGLTVDDTPVPIICLTIGDGENMQRIQRELMQRGVLIASRAVYSGIGTVGAPRVAVFSTHTVGMIGQLIDELRRLL